MNIHFLQFGWDQESKLYLANNGLFELKCLDLKKQKLSVLFKRDYKRIAIKPEWRRFTHPRSYKTRKKYYRHILDDILRIRVINDKIWLFTSTFDQNNLIQVEVLNTRGKHLGTLKVPMPKSLHLMKLSYLPLAFHLDYLLVFTDSDEGGMELGIYKFTSVPPWAN